MVYNIYNRSSPFAIMPYLGLEDKEINGIYVNNEIEYTPPFQ